MRQYLIISRWFPNDVIWQDRICTPSVMMTFSDFAFLRRLSRVKIIAIDDNIVNGIPVREWQSDPEYPSKTI